MIQGETGSNSDRKILWLSCACALLSNCSIENAAPPADDSPPRSVPDATLTEEQREEIARLEAIGYVSGTRDAPALSGIVRHLEQSASPGLNLYISGHAPVAILMDMHGREKHRWSIDFHQLWPNSPAKEERENKNTRSWRRAYLYENGDLLAIFEGLGILKLDRDSNLIWSNDVGAHHDFEVMPDGKIFVLKRKAHLVSRLREKLPILKDYISILTPNGREKKRVSLLEAFERSEFLHILDGSRISTQEFHLGTGRDDGDIFHTNTLEVLDGRIAAHAPAFASGRILVSLRVPSVLAIVTWRTSA